MRRVGTVVVVSVVLAVACGGGGGGSADQGPPDPGLTDSGNEGTSDQATGEESGPSDPGPDLAEPDQGTLEVATKDDSAEPGGAPDVEKPDPAPADPSGDEGGPRKFVVRVKADGEGGPVSLAGAEVAVLDNATGEPLGPSGETDDKGEVALELEPGLTFGLRVKKDAYVDRYYFDIREEWGSFEVGMLPGAVVEMVSQMIGLTWDPSKGIVTGRIVFQTEQGKEDVGCAVVESDKPGEVRYWDADQDVPATLEKAPMTSKKNAQFLVANLPPGPVGLTAKVSGAIVGTKQTLSFAGGMTTVDMAVTTETNPTPADCAY